MRKKNSLLLITVIGAMLLGACVNQTQSTSGESVLEADENSASDQSDQESGLVSAHIDNDEGGAVTVTGNWNYTNFNITSLFEEPVVALLNISRQIGGNFGEFTPRTEQILGVLTTPLSPPPATYRVALPIVPTGASVDIDNNGEKDAGIQIYELALSTNFSGDSYLEQIEQLLEGSILSDPHTGKIREGTFLIYAPDAAQGFSSSAGVDGWFFTADDPVVTLPAGYTLATLTSDGEVSFDRSREVQMDILETAAAASPDFSDQGILESYNSLIDVLKAQYSYTELRHLDWENIRQTYLPQVQAADAGNDMATYFVVLGDMAMSIQDAHVQVAAKDSALTVAYVSKILEATSGSFGARVAELSDGRLIITTLDPNGPGAQTGWQFGTEIMSVDGVPIGEQIDTLLYAISESTPEGIRLARLEQALKFPVGTTITVEYRQPGESKLRTATLTAEEGFDVAPPFDQNREEISFKKLDGGYGYIQWGAFDDLLYKLAVWEKFLSTFHDSPGIVIDLRDNGGGSVALYYTMASFLFTDEQPAAFHWTDSYTYDEQVKDLVREFSADYMLSAPKPELAFSNAVIVLVNENSASSAEFFPQFLQSQDRALIIGEHSTAGAGGFIERAALPGTITFQFTKSRSVFAGTDEFNLEAKGVVLDVRVPITEEGEKAKLEGRDPVLEAALDTMAEEAARRINLRLAGNTWQWAEMMDISGKRTPIENSTSYTIDFAEDGTVAVKADCNQVSGTYTVAEENLTINLGPTTLAACPEGSRGEDFVELLGATKGYIFDEGILGISGDFGGEIGFGVMLFNPVD